MKMQTPTWAKATFAVSLPNPYGDQVVVKVTMERHALADQTLQQIQDAAINDLFAALSTANIRLENLQVYSE